MLSLSSENHYKNIKKLPSYNAMQLIINKYHAHVEKHKWAELMNQDDLRFLKCTKNILDILLHQHNGIIIKLSTWDSPILKHDYIISKKIKNVNFVKHYCYFEYEEDIFKFLCSDKYDEDIYNETAIIISPYYKNITEVLNSELNAVIIKQIILALYSALFVHYIEFKKIDIHNIYVESTNKPFTIRYKIGDNSLNIKTNHIVKIDAFSTSEIVYIHEKHNYKQLYINIIDILEQFNSNELSNLINFVKDFIGNTENIVNPIRILHGILFHLDSKL
jgi:hypothetical protein